MSNLPHIPSKYSVTETSLPNVSSKYSVTETLNLPNVLPKRFVNISVNDPEIKRKSSQEQKGKSLKKH